MSTNAFPVDQGDVRGTDSNSLLRMYDLANEICKRSSLQQERARADRALRLITKELRKRNVPLATGGDQPSHRERLEQDLQP